MQGLHNSAQDPEQHQKCCTGGSGWWWVVVRSKWIQKEWIHRVCEWWHKWKLLLGGGHFVCVQWCLRSFPLQIETESTAPIEVECRSDNYGKALVLAVFSTTIWSGNRSPECWRHRGRTLSLVQLKEWPLVGPRRARPKVALP